MAVAAGSGALLPMPLLCAACSSPYTGTGRGLTLIALGCGALCPGFQNSGILDTYQLCDVYAGYGTLQCGANYGSCPGAANSNCDPEHVWSTYTESTTNTYDRGLYKGVFVHTSDHVYTYAFGVRCVLDANNTAKNIADIL